MTTLREWVARLCGTPRPSRRDAELEEELRLHLELAVEHQQHFNSSDAAGRAAVIHRRPAGRMTARWRN